MSNIAQLEAIAADLGSAEAMDANRESISHGYERPPTLLSRNSLRSQVSPITV